MTEADQTDVQLHGRPLTELIGEASFGEVIYLLWTGRVAEQGEGRVIEALLVASSEFGPMPTSTRATRLAASCGVPLPQAVIAGLACVGQYHAPIEAAARMLRDMSIWEAGDLKPIPGLGHPLYKEQDPRLEPLLQLTTGQPRPHWQKLLNIQLDYRFRKGRHLPINLAGAAAALLLDIGVPAEYATGIFLIGRLPGLVMHAVQQAADPNKLTLWQPQQS
jgi:citrate synthase